MNSTSRLKVESHPYITVNVSQQSSEAPSIWALTAPITLAMGKFLPPEIWTLILTYASGSPRLDVLLPGQHLQVALKPSAILKRDNTSSATAHKNINGECTSCALHLFDQKTLINACLATKQSYDASVALLYREPVIPTQRGCMLLLRTLLERPDLAAHVRWLSLQGLDEAREEGAVAVDDRRLPHAFIQRYDELALRSGQAPARDQLSPKKLDGNTSSATILSFLPNLRRTSLSHLSGQIGVGLSPQSLMSLNSVELSQMNTLANYTVADLHWLAEAAPNISTLTLKGHILSDNNQVTAKLERPTFANVTCLCLVNSLIPARWFREFMKSFPNMKQLDFLRPKCVFNGTDFVDTLVHCTPHVRDLRVQFIDQRRNVMKFGRQELARLKELQRLWIPFSCFVPGLDEFIPEAFVQGLPSSLQHLSMIHTVTVESLLSETVKAIATDVAGSGSRLTELRSVMISAWDFDVGNSGPTSRSFEIEEAMVQAGRMMDGKGVRLTVEGGIANLEDHYMGFERIVRRYAEGDSRRLIRTRI